MIGFRSSEAVATVAEAEAALEMGDFSGMVLDLMLTDGSGLDLLARLRARGSTLPVLMLTARDRQHERVAGLNGGADDYLGKPSDLEELAACLRAILRRASSITSPPSARPRRCASHKANQRQGQLVLRLICATEPAGQIAAPWPNSITRPADAAEVVSPAACPLAGKCEDLARPSQRSAV